MLKRTVLLSAGAIAVLVAGAFAQAGGGKDLRLLGKVKRVEADGPTFDLTAKGKTYEVALAPGADVVRHRAVSFDEVKSGITAHVLGRKQASTYDSNSGRTLPEQIIGIIAIVAGEKFAPPPLSRNLAKKKVEWIKGKLDNREGRISVGGVEMQVGRNRNLILVEDAGMDALAKGVGLLVEGALEGGSRSKKLTAKRVTIIAPDVPAAEYQPVLGL